VLLADVTRLRDEVNWSAQATLKQRAADTIDWWRAKLAPAGRR
jgi:nucleoside-diphosphate-sugar epimerase